MMKKPKRSLKKVRVREYTARSGGMLPAKFAPVLGAEVEAIEAAGLPITPQAIVDRAASDGSPLHDLFEWNDAVAAHNYRIFKARNFLGCLQFIDVAVGRPVRAVCNIVIHEGGDDDDDSGGHEYRSRERVMESEDAMDQVTCRIYGDFVRAARDAEDFGLTESDRALKNIALTVRSNIPTAALLKEKFAESA